MIDTSVLNPDPVIKYLSRIQTNNEQQRSI